MATDTSAAIGVRYTVPLTHEGYVFVPSNATDAQIRAAIEDDMPKHVTVRVYGGESDDATYSKEGS